ncbi:MAG: hypothetical protein EOP76_11645 [Variovorax sp.]|nr:MAG: hypothetical protein EOP76_11645 [Variovorax sp.]
MNKAPGDDIVTRSTNWLTVVLAFASASGIILALLGYGVALAVEARFGLPHTFTFNSTLDLFSLGTWAIADLLTGSYSWSSWAFYKDVLVRSARVLMPVFVMCLIGFVLFWAWLSASRRLSRRHPQQKLRAAKVVFKRNARQKSWVVSGSIFLFSSIVTTLLIPVAAIGIAALTFVFCVLAAVLPGIGLTAGKSHIDKWVVQPTSCHSNAPEVARAPGPMANCLSIKRADNSVEKGRVVFATSTSVILYDPSTGHAKRLGIEGSVITTISALD